MVEDVQGTEIDEADLDGPGTWYVYAGKGGSSKAWANHPAVQAGEIRHAPCPRLEYRAKQGEAAGETENPVKMGFSTPYYSRTQASRVESLSQ